MDKMVQEAFRLNVKWSLQELSRAINGDGKSAPNPLFKVNVVLEGMAVEFSPTLKQLASIVGSIHGYLTETLKNIKRLPDILSRKRQGNKEVNDHFFLLLYRVQVGQDMAANTNQT
jgi:dynein heavy chain